MEIIRGVLLREPLRYVKSVVEIEQCLSLSFLLMSPPGYRDALLIASTGASSKSVTVNREAIKSTSSAEEADSESGSELSVRARTAVTSRRCQHGSEELQLNRRSRNHELHSLFTSIFRDWTYPAAFWDW